MTTLNAATTDTLTAKIFDACADFPAALGCRVMCLWEILVNMSAQDMNERDAVGTGWPLEFGHLFSGFRQRVGSLVAVGVLTTLLSVVAILIVALFFGTSLMSMMALAKLDPSILARSTGLLVAVVALTAVLLLPLSMAW